MKKFSYYWLVIQVLATRKVNVTDKITQTQKRVRVRYFRVNIINNFTTRSDYL